MEEHLSSWLDFLYMLSIVKIAISITKYMPQVSLNYKRKSTCGWNIWNIVLDCTGGTLSIVQQIGDSWDLRDYSGVTGNPAKFGLGFVSIFFDLIFFLQHYVLYPDDHTHGDMNSSIGDSAESGGGMCSDGALTEPLLNADNKEYTEVPAHECIG
jgi:cystinosin